MTAACWAEHLAAKMAEWTVEPTVVLKAVQKVENLAGLMAVRWAVCSVEYSAAPTVANLVPQWAESSVVQKAALMAAGWVASTAARKAARMAGLRAATKVASTAEQMVAMTVEQKAG